MPDLHIVQVRPEDLASLRAISLHTFVATFAHLNTPENMAKYVAERLSLNQLGQELADPNSAFYFAELAGQRIGYLKVNYGAAQTDLQELDSLEIERIYVVQEWLGKGVAQALLAHAEALARKAGMQSIWLAVWEENPRAIRFYEKSGFVTFDKHIFVLGDDAQTDWMMRLDLRDPA
jgi:GNAT superfamily N-acetyltransferase